MDNKQRAAYLDAESEAGRELAMWTAQFPPGPHQALLGLLHYQLAVSVREQKAALVKDLANAANSVQKSAVQHQLLAGELWDRQQQRAFRERFCDIVTAILQRRLPGDTWMDALDEIADELAKLEHETTQAAKAEAPKRITLR